MNYAIVASCTTENGSWGLTVDTFTEENELAARQRFAGFQFNDWPSADRWSDQLGLLSGSKAVARRYLGDAANEAAIQAVSARLEGLSRVQAATAPTSRQWEVAAMAYAALRMLLTTVTAEGGALSGYAFASELAEKMRREMGAGKETLAEAIGIVEAEESRFYVKSRKYAGIR